MKTKTKQESFEILVKNLDEMIYQYRLLLDCVRKEKDFLIQNDILNLNTNNELKEQILLNIKNKDVLRTICVKELAQILGLNTTEPRLLELAKKIGGREGEKLNLHHATLEFLTKQLMQFNKENAVFAESALRTVNSAMENIKEHFMGQKTYQKKGNYQQGHDKSGHLVSKEA